MLEKNDSVFFPHSRYSSFFSKFIAWLNLDLGIETCFYNGLDSYAKTWFEFLFPVYIWFLVTVIIIVSHYSTQASKLVGNNAVQVLATLFLLSYAKLLRFIIRVLSSTIIDTDGCYKRVWLYDGNVDYLVGKHTLLFAVALFFLVFMTLPFTTILLCIQCIQRLSNFKLLSWIGKLHPLFDAYTGPYKIKHQYWTGLLLLIRIFIFLICTFNTIGNPKINLLGIAILMSCLLAYISLTGGVYKSWWLNLMEISFIFNLLMLSILTSYAVNKNTSTKPIAYTSTSATLVLFIGILLYHIFLKVQKTKHGQAIFITIKKTFSSGKAKKN